MMSTSGVTPTTHGTPNPAPVTAPTPSILAIKTHEGTITKVAGDGLTGPNWVTWQVHMMSLLTLCEVEPYVQVGCDTGHTAGDLTSHHTCHL